MLGILLVWSKKHGSFPGGLWALAVSVSWLLAVCTLVAKPTHCHLTVVIKVLANRWLLVRLTAIVGEWPSSPFGIGKAKCPR